MSTSGQSSPDGQEGPLFVNPPSGKTPEGWLSEYDRQPNWLPQWPASTSMALVCVSVVREPDITNGIVVLSRKQLDELSDPEKTHRLFFRVPRQILLSDDNCPGLSPDSFED